MPKTTHALFGAVVLAVALVGCSAQTNTPATSAPQPAAAAVSSAPTSTPDVTAPGDADAAFLSKVKSQWTGTMSYTDAQLIGFGHAACALLDQGENESDVQVLPDVSSGDLKGNNSTIVRRAELQYCTQWA